MQASEIKAGHCYATAENQQRKVVRVERDKVWFETFRADRPGVWLSAHAEDAPRSVREFAAEVVREIPCVDHARVGTGG
jgi:hypothetical protein